MTPSSGSTPMRLLFALAIVALLAGCAAPAVQPAAIADIELPWVGPLSDVSTVIDPQGGHGEPSFGAMPDGTLFANGDGGLGGGVYRSQDQGATWERIATPVEPMPNLDPDLAVDKDGTLWYSALWIGCTSTATSQDAGETWNFNPLACNTLAADRQYVVPTSGGTAYLYSHQLPTFYQMAAKTTDYGQTWIPTAPIEPFTNTLVTKSSGWGGGGFWNAATGSVFFTWSWSDGSPGFGVSRDEGASWEVGAIKSMGGRALGLGLVTGAADDEGNVYLTWGEQGGGDDVGDGVAIYLAISRDDGKTWSDPLRVDDSTGSKVFPTVTAGPAGKVAVGYYEAPDEAYPSDVKGLWNVTLAWSDDALAAAPVWQHGTLSVRPVKQGGICIDGTTCQGDREFADYFQVHRLPDGRVGAVYNSLLDVDGVTVEVYAQTRDTVLA